MNDKKTIYEQMFLPAFHMYYTYHKAKPTRISYLIGKVILLSFACEIGLKSLIKLKTGILAKGHHLDKLFNELSSELQNIIVKSTKYSDEEFYHKLKENKRHFEKWRYSYEGCDKVDLQFMEALLGILCYHLMPDEELKYYFPELYKD